MRIKPPSALLASATIVALALLAGCGSSSGDPAKVARQAATTACEMKVLDDLHIGNNARFDSIAIKANWADPTTLAPAANDKSTINDAQNVLAEGNYEVTGNVNGTAFDCAADGEAGWPATRWKATDNSAYIYSTGN